MKYLIILAILLSSCGTTYKINKCKKWGVCQTDSVIITHKETIKEEIFVIDSGYVEIDLLLDCDSLNNVYLKHVNKLENENLDLKFKFKDGKMLIYVTQPPDSIKVFVKEIEKGETIIKNIEVNRITKIQKFLINSGFIGWIIFILGSIIFVIIKFK
jgi:hypothetical protein